MINDEKLYLIAANCKLIFLWLNFNQLIAVYIQGMFLSSKE